MPHSITQRATSFSTIKKWRNLVPYGVQCCTSLQAASSGSNQSARRFMAQDRSRGGSRGCRCQWLMLSRLPVKWCCPNWSFKKKLKIQWFIILGHVFVNKEEMLEIVRVSHLIHGDMGSMESVWLVHAHAARDRDESAPCPKMPKSIRANHLPQHQSQDSAPKKKPNRWQLRTWPSLYHHSSHRSLAAQQFFDSQNLF